MSQTIAERMIKKLEMISVLELCSSRVVNMSLRSPMMAGLGMSPRMWLMVTERPIACPLAASGTEFMIAMLQGAVVVNSSSIPGAIVIMNPFMLVIVGAMKTNGKAVIVRIALIFVPM